MQKKWGKFGGIWGKIGEKKRVSRCFRTGLGKKILKHAKKQQVKLYDIGFYKLSCDTCDSKNAKTPVLRVCTRARERGRL